MQLANRCHFAAPFLVIVVLASCSRARAEEEPTLQILQTESVELQGETQTIEVLDRPGLLVSVAENEEKVTEISEIEVVVSDPDETGAAPRRVWWSYRSVLDKTFVVGTPVCGVGLWEKENDTKILLAFGNSYYWYKSIYEIDPDTEYPVDPNLLQSDAEGRRTQVPPNPAPLLKVPREVDYILGGTKSLSISGEGDIIQMTVEYAGDHGPRTITYNTQTEQWSFQDLPE